MAVVRRKDFRKANSYTGQKLKGSVDISYKIDGVRMLDRDGEQVTRNNKTPPGWDKASTQAAKDKLKKFKDCEVYVGDFIATNAPLSRHDPEEDIIDAEHVYPLDTTIGGHTHGFDSRLTIATITDPSEILINKYLAKALALGYEGLVLRTEDRWYRVKPYYTADVYVTGLF